MTTEAILFYDGRCPACRTFTRLALAGDTRRRLRSATLDSPEADEALGHLSHEERYGSFHLAVGGRVLSGTEAIGPLLEMLPPVRAAGRLIDRSPVAARLAGGAYDVLARHRSALAGLLRRVGPPPR